MKRTLVPMLFALALACPALAQQKPAEKPAEPSVPKPDPLAEEYKKFEGPWQRTETTPNGQSYRIVKQAKGKKETLTVYDPAGNVVHQHQVDFRLEHSGKVRIYTYFNYEITAGPDKGLKAPQPVSYIYRFEGDQLIQVDGLLIGDRHPPMMYFWKRDRKESHELTAARRH